MSSIKSSVAFCFISALLLMASADAATLSVNSIADDGSGACAANHCTLRDALSSAAAGDTIAFSLPANSAITLVTGELVIDKDLTIEGPGANLLTVQRSYAADALRFRIFNIAAHVVIVGLTIANGDTYTNPGGLIGTGGGGILNSSASASVSIINSTISGSQALNGGGIFNHGGTVNVTNSAIVGDRSFYRGGGIFNDNSGGTVAITNSTISGNNRNKSYSGVLNDGGGIYNAGVMTITNSTVSDNSTDGKGGGISINEGNVTIANSTVSGNSAPDGGGISNDATVTITNSTISGNSATFESGFGGGIVNFTGTPLFLKNTIVARNTASRFGADVAGTLTSQGYNLIGSSDAATILGDTTGNLLNVDPILGPLQDNGGPTKTHALLPGSPAIDAGHAGGAVFDQRGFARTVDDPRIPNAVSGDGSDIGAYEIQADHLAGCNSVNHVVNNNNDSGTDSLRDVIANVCAGTTITFAANVRGAINLTTDQLWIGKSLTINGPGAKALSVQRSAAPGTPAFRIFNIGSANAAVTLSGLTIANGNAFPAAGGGILSSGAVTIANCAVSGNVALNGGGLWNDFGTATLTNSTISGNTVSNNSSAGSGGGIFNHGGTLNITSSTLSGNSAIGPGASSDSGGGIITNVGVVNLTNSTISGNMADFGGGIRNVNGGVVNSKNTLIALNTSASGPDVNGPLTSRGFNLIGNASGASISPAQSSDQIGVTSAQLKLGPLRDNGGPTLTHALLSGSFAIDRGHASGSTADQRGFTRVVDVPAIPNATGGDGSDVGAYEFDGTLPKKAGLPWLLLLLAD